MTNYGLRQGQLPWLMQKDGRPVGVKMMNGDEILLPFLSADGRSLIDIDGNQFTPVIAGNIQKVTPTTGSTVQMSDTALDGTLYIALPGAVDNVTLVLPTEKNSRMGQIRRIASRSMVTNLTITGGTLLSTITSLSAGDCFQFQKIDTNTWTRIQ